MTPGEPPGTEGRRKAGPITAGRRRGTCMIVGEDHRKADLTTAGHRRKVALITAEDRREPGLITEGRITAERATLT